jgi:hypothetical protein
MAPYNKPAGKNEKVYWNERVDYAYNVFVRPFVTDSSCEKVALVLDDQNLQSTKSILTNDPTMNVILAQNDRQTFIEMRSNAYEFFCMNNHIYPNFPKIIKGEYSEISVPEHSIYIDQADYCKTWKSNRNVHKDRFQKSMYAHRALLRVTVSYRGLNCDGDENVEWLVNDIQDMCIGTPYQIKPLTIEQIDPDFT